MYWSRMRFLLADDVNGTRSGSSVLDSGPASVGFGVGGGVVAAGGMVVVDGAALAGSGSTRNGPITAMRQFWSRAAQAATAPSTAPRSELIPVAIPRCPPAPSATALQPWVALASRRAISARSSGNAAASASGAYNPTVRAEVGTAAAK